MMIWTDTETETREERALAAALRQERGNLTKMATRALARRVLARLGTDGWELVRRPF